MATQLLVMISIRNFLVMVVRVQSPSISIWKITTGQFVSRALQIPICIWITVIRLVRQCYMSDDILTMWRRIVKITCIYMNLAIYNWITYYGEPMNQLEQYYLVIWVVTSVVKTINTFWRCGNKPSDKVAVQLCKTCWITALQIISQYRVFLNK